MAVKEQGHCGKYSGNSRHSYNHAHTKVTAGNYEATKRDDEAHMDYLKRDVLYDAHHGHSDANMTSDEKHISKLAGDLKYDEKHHGPAHYMPYADKKWDHHGPNKELKGEQHTLPVHLQKAIMASDGPGRHCIK